MSQNNIKVVAIGGGTGLSVLLRGLKRFPLDISAIVTVADDGGSTGRLRSEMALPAVGDIRNVIAAMSDAEPLLLELFQHRFKTGDGLEGHALGNLFLAAMSDITGDFSHAVREISRVFNVKGRVFPAANENVTLHAVYEDGTTETGESKIPLKGKRIQRVHLTPEDVEPLFECVDAIRQADLIILGPGSLYTSVIPNLLVERIRTEILRSSAKKVYICNVMTQKGETTGYTVSDHVQALNDHMGEPFLDSVVVNTKEIPKDIVEKYQKELSTPVEVDEETLEGMDVQVIKGNIVKFNQSVIRHDYLKIANLLMNTTVSDVSQGV